MSREEMSEERIRIIVGRADVHSVEEFISVLREIASCAGVCVQAFDAMKVASKAHIVSAVHKALRAFKKKRNISPDLGMEILLYASGDRQIRRALEMGISEGENKKVAIVIVDSRGIYEHSERSESGEQRSESSEHGESSEEKRLDAVVEEVKMRLKIREEALDDLSGERAEIVKRFFHITDEEIAAVGEEKLEKLVLERVALLDVKK